MGFKIIANMEGLSFEGILDETIPPSVLQNAHEELIKLRLKSPIKTDFSKVERANSVGLVSWLKFLKNINQQVKYVNCPVWLVQCFSLMPDLLQNQSFAESIQVPFYCEDKNKNIIKTFQINKDIPILNDYSNFNFPKIEIDGSVYEIDVDLKKYLHFLSRKKS